MSALQLFLFFAIIIYLFYVVLVIIYTYGWFSLGSFVPNNTPPSTKVSIIVPARNEAGVIEHCLLDISLQEYPPHLVEIIVVDDSSTDSTAEVVHHFIKEHPLCPIQLVQLKEKKGEQSYKKKAITSAMALTTGKLIVTTDADCRMGNKWISTLVNYYETYQVKMIVSPVSFHQEDSVFEKIQTVEFLTLIATSAASVTLKHPIMCNGANLAYEKDIFDLVGGYSDNTKFASGDDVFLLHKMNKEGLRIGFIRNYEATVFTYAKKTIKDFWHQRIRWASKSRGYSDKITIAVALIIYLYNVILLALLGISFFHAPFLFVFFFFYISKLLLDLPITASILHFVQRSSLVIYFIPMQIFYSLYMVIVGSIGSFSSYEWKGRRVK